jgi:hypothetical protein
MLAVNHKPFVVHVMWKMDDVAKYVVKIPFIKKYQATSNDIHVILWVKIRSFAILKHKLLEFIKQTKTTYFQVLVLWKMSVVSQEWHSSRISSGIA